MYRSDEIYHASWQLNGKLLFRPALLKLSPSLTIWAHFVSRDWRNAVLAIASTAKRWASTGEREISSAVRLGSPNETHD
jgi:hypothetical protein